MFADELDRIAQRIEMRATRPDGRRRTLREMESVDEAESLADAWRTNRTNYGRTPAGCSLRVARITSD